MSISVADVKRLLPAYGYTPQDSDSLAIQECIDNRIRHTRWFCNIKVIPADLEPEVIRMSVGQFLYMKNRLNQLEDGGIQFPKRLSQFTEGDISLSFSGAGKEEDGFDDYINELRHGDYHILEHFRRLQW